MPKTVDLAVNVLRDNATFFRVLGENTPVMKEQMDEKAQTCESIALLLEQNPEAELEAPAPQ